MAGSVGRKFAVLHCAEDSDYVKRKHGGYFGVFVKMLAEEDETWRVFNISAGDFPSDEEIDEYQGFVITGSCSDAHGDDPWVCRLVFLLQKLDAMKKKVLGICFGHQILGRAIGGKVCRAELGWDIGVANINLSPSIAKVFPSLKLLTVLSLIECHRDEVKELPPGAEIMAWSDKTSIEMFRCGSHFMGIQGHPEYDKGILLDIVDRLLQNKYISEWYADDVRANVEKLEPDKEEWRKICVGFLKGRM